MDFTDEQYAVMEKLADRLIWDDLTPAEKHIMEYFHSKKIAEPRAYIEDGLWVLSEDGKRILAAHHADLKSREQEAQDKAREKAEQKADKQAEHRFQLGLTLLSSVLSFLGGLLIEHFIGIIDLISVIVTKNG